MLLQLLLVSSVACLVAFPGPNQYSEMDYPGYCTSSHVCCKTKYPLWAKDKNGVFRPHHISWIISDRVTVHHRSPHGYPTSAIFECRDLQLTLPAGEVEARGWYVLLCQHGYYMYIPVELTEIPATRTTKRWATKEGTCLRYVAPATAQQKKYEQPAVLSLTLTMPNSASQYYSLE